VLYVYTVRSLGAVDPGTVCEHDAVRERWAAIERRRRRTTRLLVGFVLCGTGLLCLGTAAVREACSGGGGYPWTCTAVVSAPAATALTVVGLLAAVGGVGLCVTAVGR
jgi:hypothetical protein